MGWGTRKQHALKNNQKSLLFLEEQTNTVGIDVAVVG
jgi:hypothetical protein